MTHGIIPIVTARDSCITKVTFTVVWGGPSIHFVVWQFWGRAARGVLSVSLKALFLLSVNGAISRLPRARR